MREEERIMKNTEKRTRPFLNAIQKINELSVPSYEIGENKIKKFHDGMSEDERKVILFCENEIQRILNLAQKEIDELEK